MPFKKPGWMQRASGSMHRGYGKAVMGGAGALGRTAFSPMRGTMLFGGIAAAAFHDPTKNTFSSHMAQEGLKLGGDALMEGALFSTLGAGMKGGMIGLAASVALYGFGLNPGEMIGSSLEGAKAAYKKQQNGGITPITQNERTMRATAQNLKMLGQSTGRYSMLGHEAQYMHN